MWKAAEGLGYPFGDLTRLLVLTGQRLRECAEADWREIDLEAGVWTIPAARTKGKVAHEVPLAPSALAFLKALPRGTGPFLFSTTGGVRPVAGFSKARDKLRELTKESVEDWSYHDLRRTMRTGLGGLPVPTNVAEMCIAHAQPGLHRVYDLYSYRDEKRAAFALWEHRVSRILGRQN